MSKWKCGICNREFENHHAQGFDNIIYCPLCYYKELYKRDKKEIERLNNIIDEADTKNLELIQKINKIYDVIENKNITGIEARLLIQDMLDKEE